MRPIQPDERDLRLQFEDMVINLQTIRDMMNFMDDNVFSKNVDEGFTYTIATHVLGRNAILSDISYKLNQLTSRFEEFKDVIFSTRRVTNSNMA